MSGPRHSQREQVLRRLQQGPATVRDFMDMGISRFGARIWELRGQGYEITSTEKRVNGQRYVTYRLEALKDATVSVHDSAVSVLACAECGQRLARKPKARPLLEGEKPYCSDACRAAAWRKKKSIAVQQISTGNPQADLFTNEVAT